MLTSAQVREVFMAADADCNGTLDVAEFTALLRQLSPKAHSADETIQVPPPPVPPSTAMPPVRQLTRPRT